MSKLFSLVAMFVMCLLIEPSSAKKWWKGNPLKKIEKAFKEAFKDVGDVAAAPFQKIRDELSSKKTEVHQEQRFYLGDPEYTSVSGSAVIHSVATCSADLTTAPKVLRDVACDVIAIKMMTERMWIIPVGQNGYEAVVASVSTDVEGTSVAKWVIVTATVEVRAETVTQ